MNPAVTAVCLFLILLCLYVIIGTIKGAQKRKDRDG